MKKPIEPVLDDAPETERTSSLLTADGKTPKRRKPHAADLVGQDRPMLTRDQPQVDVEERRQPQAGGRGVRELAVTPDSYDASARTVEAILSAGSAVRRYYFTEELEISAEAIDLGRVEKGICPLLDTNNNYASSYPLLSTR